MKIPVEWMNELLGQKLSARNMAEYLELAGVEIDGISELPLLGSKFVVGLVTSVKPHPNADKLKLTSVDVGKTSLDIVCGAPNVAMGQKVVVALPGAVLPDGLAIKKLIIRGENSAGMICSQKELGRGGDHSGIIVLPPKTRIGAKADEALFKSVVIHATTSPNRWDLNSLWGLSREISAQQNKSFTYKLPEQISSSKPAVKVSVSKPALSSRYILAKLKVDSSQPTPEVISRRLEEAGLRSLGAVIDITNYVALELGQPLHAFDAAKVNGPVQVRLAKKGEKLKTLDGVQRTLSDEDLIIADSSKVLALAGVMGGQDSEVSSQTSEILLESASFDGPFVRKTALRHGLRSEASARFERVIPVQSPPQGLARAVELLKRHAKGELLGISEVSQPRPAVQKIKIDVLKVSQLLGVSLKDSDVRQYIQRPGWQSSGGSGVLTLEIPWWRPDVAAMEDVAEEIIKLVGFDQLPAKLPEWRPEAIQFDQEWAPLWRGRNVLRSMGWFEVVTYSFVSEPQLLELGWKPDLHLKLKNPKSSEQAYMRRTLLPSLLQAAAKNRGYGRSFGLFEFSKTYWKKKAGQLPHEFSVVAGLVVHPDNAFAPAKAALDRLSREFNAKVEVRPQDFSPDVSDPARSGVIYIGGERAGVIGELQPQLLQRHKLRSKVAFFELNWQEFLKTTRPVTYQPISRFPGVSRDISIEVDRDVSWARLTEALESVPAEVRFLSDYYGPEVAEGKKGITFRVSFSSPTRTLTDSEVDEAVSEIAKDLQQRFDARLR